MISGLWFDNIEATGIESRGQEQLSKFLLLSYNGGLLIMNHKF